MTTGSGNWNGRLIKTGAVVVAGGGVVLVVDVKWCRNDSTALVGDELGQQTPGTNRLWKQMDWRRLARLSSSAGQLLRS